MADWPLPGRGSVTTYGAGFFSGPFGTLVTASSTAHTKGSWAEIAATTTREASAIDILITGTGSRRFLVDVGFGAGGSEVVVIANIAHTSVTTSHVNRFRFPIYVPVGTRIAMRCQSGASGSGEIRALCYLRHGGFGLHGLGGFSTIDTYGADTATSGAVNLNPASTHTKTAYAELTASTTRAHKGLIVAPVDFQTASALGTDYWMFDWAVGAASSEQIFLANHASLRPGSNAPGATHPLFVPASMPAGSRLAVRVQTSEGDASDDSIDAQIFGVS